MDHRGVPLTITPTASGYVASDERSGSEVSASTLLELVRLLDHAGCHSTDIADAVDAAGLDWPGTD